MHNSFLLQLFDEIDKFYRDAASRKHKKVCNCLCYISQGATSNKPLIRKHIKSLSAVTFVASFKVFALDQTFVLVGTNVQLAASTLGNFAYIKLLR